MQAASGKPFSEIPMRSRAVKRHDTGVCRASVAIAPTIRQATQSGQPAANGHGTPLVGSPALGPGAVWVPQYRAVNFTLESKEATEVSLCLFRPDDLAAGRVAVEHKLSPEKNRTGDTWHIMLPDIDRSLLYAFRVVGPNDEVSRFRPAGCVVDPWAELVISRNKWGALAEGPAYGQEGVLGLSETWPQFAASLPRPRGEYDWEGDRPLNLAMEDVVIYEMHVRGFTQHPSSGLPDHERGTFKGAVKKLSHVARMGFTAVELMPIQEFNELEYYQLIPGSQDTYRFNFWGYSTVGFFAPMARYASDPYAALDEFRDFVKESHRLGMEVYLDVVFNHTAEGNHMGPTLSFRGIDNKVFYMLAPRGEYYNFSGCGNTVNCNHPIMRRFIVDCLRFWVEEMHVDGFRFDLGSILTRAPSSWHLSNVGTTKGLTPQSPEGAIMPSAAGMPAGTPLAEPPLIQMISEDPLLRKSKMIAEAWDCGGLVQVGAFPHFGGRWSEWNGRFRDTARNFIKGSDGWVGKMASAICGSPELYLNQRNDPDDWWPNNGGRQWTGNRGPLASVNVVTAHDGFTLRDLVSYNAKRNSANGEDNRDGEEHNNSWNCGVEGETNDQRVMALRDRQVRNFMVALLMSQGVPMVLMGDEYGHTKNGNNNTYCHDSELNWFRWDKLKEQEGGLAHFVSALLHIRKTHWETRRRMYMG